MSDGTAVSDAHMAAMARANSAVNELTPYDAAIYAEICRRELERAQRLAMNASLYDKRNDAAARRTFWRWRMAFLQEEIEFFEGQAVNRN